MTSSKTVTSDTEDMTVRTNEKDCYYEIHPDMTGWNGGAENVMSPWNEFDGHQIKKSKRSNDISLPYLLDFIAAISLTESMQTFGLLHSNLQQNAATSSSFLKKRSAIQWESKCSIIPSLATNQVLSVWKHANVKGKL